VTTTELHPEKSILEKAAQRIKEAPGRCKFSTVRTDDGGYVSTFELEAPSVTIVITTRPGTYTYSRTKKRHTIEAYLTEIEVRCGDVSFRSRNWRVGGRRMITVEHKTIKGLPEALTAIYEEVTS